MCRVRTNDDSQGDLFAWPCLWTEWPSNRHGCGGSCGYGYSYRLATLALVLWLTRRVTRPLKSSPAAPSGLPPARVCASMRRATTNGAGPILQRNEPAAGGVARLGEDREQLPHDFERDGRRRRALDDEHRSFSPTNSLAFARFSAPGMRDENSGKSWRSSCRTSSSVPSPSGALPGRSKRRPAHGVASPSRGRLPGSPLRSTVLALHDTTELRRLESLRQDFVATGSHELETPLAVIKANIETLLEGAIDDTVHGGQFLERIAEQGRLYALILDLLSLAHRMGNKAFTFQSVIPVVTACLERHRAPPSARCKPPAVPPPGDADLAAWGDEEASSRFSITWLTMP